MDPPSVTVRADLQTREKSFLGYIDAADPLYSFFAFLLFFEELAFAGNIAAVALRNNVLANRRDGLASDDFRPDRGLNRHLEHLPGDELPHLRNQRLAAIIGKIAMHDDGERIHRLARHQDIELDHWRLPVAGQVIVEGSVAA